MMSYRYLFSGLVVIALAQIIYYFPQLPQVVASHFDAAGAANGWSGRETFFGVYLAMIILQIVVFVMLPQRSIYSGSFSLKLPNRDYWLAPERLSQTRQFFKRQMMLMGVIHLLLTISTVQLVILANLERDGRLDDTIYWLLGLYFLLLCTWLLHFLLHFRKP